MAAELVAMLALCQAGDEIVFVLGRFMECEKRRQTPCTSIVTVRTGTAGYVIQPPPTTTSPS